MLNLKDIKAFTFDTGGTVLDWHSGFKLGFEKLNKNYNLSLNCEELANEFRRKSLKIVTSQNENSLINFDEAHKIAVEEILLEHNISIDNEDKKNLFYYTPSKLLTWSDFLEPFDNLKKHYLCVSFTLLSNRLVFLNSKRNKINWDLILSCETLEVYKPNLEAYKKTARLLQLDPSECVMVACHSFDLNAAKLAGFKTIFVKRDKEWGPNTDILVDGKYDLVISSFNELNKLLQD